MSIPVEVWRRHKKLHNYLNERGKVLTWTKIFVAPSGFEHLVPYFVGIIDFGPSTSSGQVKRMSLQIVDCEEVKTGMEVITVIRKGEKAKPEGVIEYSLKVKPFDNTQGKPL